MNARPTARLAVAGVLLGAVWGCTHTLPLGRMGMVQRAGARQRDGAQVPARARVSGEACGLMVAGSAPDARVLEEATRAAMAKGGPGVAALDDTRVEAGGSELVVAGYPLMVRRCIRVSGVPVTPGASPSSEEVARAEDAPLAPTPWLAPAPEERLEDPDDASVEDTEDRRVALHARPDVMGYLRVSMLGGGAMHPRVEAAYLKALLLGAFLAPTGAQGWVALLFYPDVSDEHALNMARLLGALGALLPVVHCCLLPLPLACWPALIVPPVGGTLMATVAAVTQVGWLAVVVVAQTLVIPRAVALAYSDALRVKEAQEGAPKAVTPPAAP